MDLHIKTCGECTECCLGAVTADISGFKIGNGIPCKHVSENGCGIHASRTDVCRDFSCGWLLDKNMPNAFRPDKSGAIILKNRHTHDEEGVDLITQSASGYKSVDAIVNYYSMINKPILVEYRVSKKKTTIEAVGSSKFTEHFAGRLL